MKNNSDFVERYISMQGYQLIIILAAVLLVYIQIIPFDLVYCDDHEIIRKQSIVKEFSIPAAFANGYMNTNYYRPIVITSFMWDYALGGESAVPYHITNLLLHASFCIAVFFFLRIISKSRFLPLAASLIFAIHPVFLNSVAWIPGRNDILYGLFCILAAVMLFYYTQKKSLLHLLIHFLCLVLAFFTKETSLIFPALLLLLLYLNQGREAVTLLKWLLPGWAVLYIFYFMLRSSAHLGNDINTYGWDIFLTNLRVYPEYISKFLLPARLSVLATYGLYNTIAGIIFACLITIGIILNYKNIDKKNVVFGLAWFILLILPNLFISLKNAPDWNDYLESRFYFPALGFIILLSGISLNNVPGFRKLAQKSVAITILLLLAGTNVIIARNYANAESFYENAVNNDPSRSLFHYILGRFYNAHDKIDIAEKHIKAAAGLRKNNFTYNLYAGEYYLQNKQFQDALHYLHIADSLEPGKLHPQMCIAYSYASNGDYERAINIWERIAASGRDKSGDVNDFLALAYLKSGNYQKADEYAGKMKLNKLNASILSMEYYRAARKNFDTDYPLFLKLVHKAYVLDTTNKYAKKAIDILSRQEKH